MKLRPVLCLRAREARGWGFAFPSGCMWEVTRGCQGRFLRDGAAYWVEGGGGYWVCGGRHRAVYSRLRGAGGPGGSWRGAGAEGHGTGTYRTLEWVEGEGGEDGAMYVYVDTL